MCGCVLYILLLFAFFSCFLCDPRYEVTLGRLRCLDALGEHRKVLDSAIALWRNLQASSIMRLCMRVFLWVMVSANGREMVPLLCFRTTFLRPS